MNPLKHLRQDLPASIVVFFVAVPLCLGIALASGAPPMSGLLAGIVGGIVVGAISGSPLGVSGPAAGLAVIVLTAIEDLGAFDVFLVAVVLAGAMQFGLGLMRAGVLGYFFPSSVIKGMLSGIGIIIILKQIPHAFGHDSDPEGDVFFRQSDGENTFSAIAHVLDGVSWSATLVSVVSIAILIFWERSLKDRFKFFQVVQGPIMAVVFGILFELITTKMDSSWALSRDHLVSVDVASSFSEFAGSLTHPDWSALSLPSVWITAATIAVVASLETLLCVEATDRLDPLKRITPTNRELVAQGAGNMVSGLVGGLPVTQVIVRSSANIQSGGRTKTSAIMHGGFILLFVVFLPSVLNLIPLAALAAVLFVVGFKLAKPSLFREMWGQGMSQFIPFITTILGIVFTDLLTGIALGMAVAIFLILRAHYRNSHFMRVEETVADGSRPRVHLTLAEEVSFLNKAALMRELDSVPDGAHVVIDASKSVHVDHDVEEILDRFMSTVERRNLEVERLERSPRGAGAATA